MQFAIYSDHGMVGGWQVGKNKDREISKLVIEIIRVRK